MLINLIKLNLKSSPIYIDLGFFDTGFCGFPSFFASFFVNKLKMCKVEESLIHASQSF